ncbi:MAG: transposase [Pseudomonadota bacterium]|nr:transposase [Pseudomonadota bacterium]
MYYIGLDVSQRQTAICIVDSEGNRIAEGKALTLPSDIHGWVKGHIEIGKVTKAGLEAGAMSNWLYVELRNLGLPIICLETFQAHRFLETHPNKTDKNDARGLAQLVRMGEAFIRPVSIRSQTSQEARALLALRQQLVKQKTSLENNIAGILKPFGLVVRRGHVGKGTFRRRPRAAFAGVLPV